MNDAHVRCPNCGQYHAMDPDASPPPNVSPMDVATSHERRDTEAEQQQMIDAFKAAVAAVMGNPPEPVNVSEHAESQQRREQELHDAFTAAVRSIVGENR